MKIETGLRYLVFQFGLGACFAYWLKQSIVTRSWIEAGLMLLGLLVGLIIFK